jgi:hypothetical protein
VTDMQRLEVMEIIKCLICAVGIALIYIELRRIRKGQNAGR